jgi:hypothetical protein
MWRSKPGTGARACWGVAAALCLAAAPAARAEDLQRLRLGGVLDLRAARTDESAGWLDGGLNKTRYGAEDGRARTVARVAQVGLLLSADASHSLGARVHLEGDAEPGGRSRRGLVDVAEAFVTYHPDLSATLRLRVRAGLLVPPASLEHVGPLWSPAYTITPSAANSWIGEEVRAGGLEARLGIAKDEHEAYAFGAVFGWNDPAGALLAWRGFALHDRQTGALDRLPLAPLPSIGPQGVPFDLQPVWSEPVREVDRRPGFYGGVTWAWAGRLRVRALHYDTRAEPTAFRAQQYGWAMRFTSAGAALELPGGLELVGQHLFGGSVMGRLPDGAGAVDFAPRASFGLASLRRGGHRLTVRYDRFVVEDRGPLVAEDDNGEEGSAWTAVCLVTLASHVRLAAEVVSVDSTRANRVRLGLPAREKELALQASLRLEFGAR